jgi:hypothetical protein
MDFKIQSFRHGDLILNHHDKFKDIWVEIKSILSSIQDQEIYEAHFSFKTPPKGLAPALNKVIKNKFVSKCWTKEAKIFKDFNYQKSSAWRLDFAKESISIEVSFNHGEAIAWNLMKPTIASELNHVKKDIQTEVGIIICASKDLKTTGGFDNATGEFEKFNLYLNPLRNQLSTPLVIIGLDAPKDFFIWHLKFNKKNRGIVVFK